MAEPSNALFDLLTPARLTRVVDIGANPIDGDPPYKALLSRRLSRVVGFEPQPEALARLDTARSDLETYLPYAIGAGGPATLHVCHAPGMTSLLEPDPHTLSHFPGFSDWGRVTARVEVETRRLCDVPEVTELDFLKLDLQGGELAVLKSAPDLLRQAVCVQAEVSFIPLYKNQPVYGEIDLALRALGFVPHMMTSASLRMIAPMRAPNPMAALNQLVEGDAVYVRNFLHPEAMSDEQLKHLALIAHYCYRSFDLALNCVHHLAERKALPMDASGRYLAIVQSGG